MVVGLFMGSSILSEVANTSILRAGLPSSQLVTNIPALASRAAGCREATSCLGTDQRSALPRQPHQVSEGKLTRQRDSGEVAVTAACDPKPALAKRGPVAMQQANAGWVENW